VRRWGAAALALGLLLGACTDDVGPEEDTADPPTITTTSVPQSDAAVRLNQLLIRPEQLAAEGFEPVVTSRRFTAQQATRIQLCGEDLREDLRIVSGRQSRFSDGQVEVSHTVTSGGDTNALLDRFEALVADCPGPWAEPALPTGGGPVQREITGPYPVPAVGVDGAGAIIRSRNAEGSSDTVVVVLVQGSVVSSLSVSGPLGSDFSVVDPAVQAAADRLLEAQSAAEP
jgi:hypothetical protein